MGCSSLTNLKLPESFYQEEIICKHIVTQKMKKVWAVELELLLELDRVCSKHHLKYFLIGGTLLGAARHQGFIPWDDDIDVIMPREDYDKLFSIAENELKYPFFFQTTLTEKEFFRAHAQLRNSLTTGCTSFDKRLKINRGIFIDIFVLDKVPNCALSRLTWRWQLYIARAFFILGYTKDPKTMGLFLLSIRKIVLIFFKLVSREDFFNYFNLNLLSRYKQKDCKFLGHLSLIWRPTLIWPKEYFCNTKYRSFCGYQFPVPGNYRDVLTRQYGNWEDIPQCHSKVRGQNSHGGLILEPEISYTIFFKDQNEQH